jgi:hypothetical protein
MDNPWLSIDGLSCSDVSTIGVKIVILSDHLNLNVEL